MTLDYFYGQAGELFSFFRIPKALFQEQRFQNLSTDAKTLYGILLDRMSLSVKNEWFDKKGRVFIIFTIEDVKRTLCCADNKAMKLFRELEKFGLVERKRRGLGKPSLVYVKNFSSDLSNERVQNRENHESGAFKKECQDPPKSRCNKNKKNKTERNNTNPILSDESKMMKNRELLEEYFSHSLEIDLLLRLYPDDEDTIYQIVNLLVDTCDSKRKLIRIAGDDKPAEVVCSRLKKLNGKTQKEVKLKLKEYQDALISGVQLDTILYFEDWADTWFEGHRDNIAPTTQESYKYCLKMLKEGFYHRPLTVIRPIDIENFLKGMRRDGRSDSYISKARGMLYQIFQKAEANDLVRRNPVRLAEKMRASGTAKRKEAFTTAEVAHLMKVLPDDRMGLSIRLLLGTGMRMQELLALEPQFIEEDGSVIHIRQAVKVVKGTVSIGSPKSKDSIRDIPVPLNVRSCAIKLRDTTDQFIWESPKTGLPCNPTHFRDVFRKSLEEAGDVRLLTPHSCRHTYVSQMQALGVDIQTIQSIVGHADTEMTEHYLHVQESIRQSAIQLFSEAFSA